MEWREEKEREGKEKRGGEEAVKREERVSGCRQKVRATDGLHRRQRQQLSHRPTGSYSLHLRSLFHSLSSTLRRFHSPLLLDPAGSTSLRCSFLFRTCYYHTNSAVIPFNPRTGLQHDDLSIAVLIVSASNAGRHLIHINPRPTGVDLIKLGV